MQAETGASLTGADESADRQRGRPRRIVGLFATTAAAVWFLDQSTKYLAATNLEPGRRVQVVGDVLQLNLSRNPGAAFSTGTGYTAALTVVALVVIVVIVRMSRRLSSRGWAVGLGLVLGGALGNVTDRLVRSPAPFRGHVVDFLELPSWPIFNLADSAICVAAVLIVALSLRGVGPEGPFDDNDEASDER